MSTIYSQQHRPPQHIQPAPSSATPDQSAVSLQRISSLLRSGPDWSATPKLAEQAPQTPAPAETAPPHTGTAASELDELGAQLTEANINTMLRAPKSKETKALLDQLRKLLTPARINALLEGPQAAANAKVLKTIATLLSPDRINPLQSAVTGEIANNYRKQSELSNLSQMTRAFDGGGEDSVGYLSNAQKGATELKRQLSEIEAVANILKEIGQVLNPDNIDAKLHSPPSDKPENTDVDTYRYSSFGETTQNAPSEIRHFDQKHKIDLTGLQKQLNKPLRLVENFSGASGEMQLHYLPSTQTSVLVVTNNPGQPPLVIKVFGEVRHSNLMV